MKLDLGSPKKSVEQEETSLEEKVQILQDLLEKILSQESPRIKKVSGEKTNILKKEFVPVEDSFYQNHTKIDLEVGDEVIVLGNAIIQLHKKEIKPPYRGVSWDDIIGQEEAVEEIKESIEELGEDLNGILLYGIPGVGKTMIAKAIAQDFAGENPDLMISLTGADLLNKYVGEGERILKEAFVSLRRTKKKTGSRGVLIIDEAEAALPSRDNQRFGGGYLATLVTTFLALTDGIETDNNPLVILLTNHANSLDSAVVRSGRVDLKIEVPPSTPEGFRKLLKHYGCPDKLHKKIVSCCANEPLTGALAKGISSRLKRKKWKAEEVEKSVKYNIINN